VKVDLQSHQLSDLPGSEDSFSPIVSPDGRWLAARHGPLLSKLAFYEFSTGKWKVFADLSDHRTAFTADSSALYFLSRDGELKLYSPANEQIKIVPSHGFTSETGANIEGAWFLGVAPDGSPVTVRDQRSTQLYAMRWER
jgi:hypothetical protein